MLSGLDIFQLLNLYTFVQVSGGKRDIVNNFDLVIK